METAATSSVGNLWVFVGLMSGVGFLDVLALFFILILTLRGESSQAADTRENLWRLVFTITAALLGLPGGRSLA